MRILAGVLIIANHKRAAVLYWYTLQRFITITITKEATGKYFNNGGNQGKLIIFLGCYADVSVFSWEGKELPQISQF